MAEGCESGEEGEEGRAHPRVSVSTLEGEGVGGSIDKRERRVETREPKGV